MFMNYHTYVKIVQNMINTVYCNAVDIKSKLMQFGFAYKIYINLENLYKISKTVKCRDINVKM